MHIAWKVKSQFMADKHKHNLSFIFFLELIFKYDTCLVLFVNLFCFVYLFGVGLGFTKRGA